jgi:hypothetical protein
VALSRRKLDEKDQRAPVGELDSVPLGHAPGDRKGEAMPEVEGVPASLAVRVVVGVGDADAEEEAVLVRVSNGAVPAPVEPAAAGCRRPRFNASKDSPYT